MNMWSHSPIQESTTSNPSKWSSYDVPWKDGAASSLAWQRGSTPRTPTAIGHRVMSSCSDKIQCKAWLPEHHHQWQRRKLRWSSHWAENIFKVAIRSWLQQTLDNTSFTDEVLSTKMCLVEQTLNARPLTAVIDDPEDLTALTPINFLPGRQNASESFMPFSERYHDLRKAFKTAQAYANMIWKRWTREYLTHWNQRSKWSKEHVRNLKEGK